ncbi:MAG: hypothetical protein WCQ64_02215 [Acidobacteriota bacterium]
MKRFVLAAALAVFAITTITTHAQKGWKLRADASTDVKDPDAPGDIKFMEMGGGFHAINPTAAIYWNPANTAKGTYTLKATFKQLKPSGHTNFLGLIFGGSNLEGPTQAYTYFVVAQDGTWTIKKRTGDGGRAAAPTVVAKTPSDAIKKLDESGVATNALEVRVGADKIDFVVNGTVVHSMPKGDIATDGIVGIRVNHLLEAMITGFGVSK